MAKGVNDIVVVRNDIKERRGCILALMASTYKTLIVTARDPLQQGLSKNGASDDPTPYNSEFVPLTKSDSLSVLRLISRKASPDC